VEYLRIPLGCQAWRQEELSPQHPPLCGALGHYVNKKGQERVYYGKEKLPHDRYLLLHFPLGWWPLQGYGKKATKES